MNDFLNEETFISSPESNEVEWATNRYMLTREMFSGMDEEEEMAYQLETYLNYAKAMRRRDREPLDPGRFIFHFFEGGNMRESVSFGGEKDGYILGSEINGVFVPTHFAPKGIIAGYRLVKDLVGSGRPTALFITEDLVDTIQKMKGWKKLPFKIKTVFRGQEVEKTLVVNKLSAIPKLMDYQIKKSVKEGVEMGKYRIDEFGRKVLSLVKRDRANASLLDEELFIE